MKILHALPLLSYHVHRMFSYARADKSHPVSTDANYGPLYWAATSVNNSSSFFLHIANIDQATVPLTGTIRDALQGASKTASIQAEATILAASPSQPYNVTNDLETPEAVAPTTRSITIHPDENDLTFNLTVPGWSYGVYRFTV